MAWDPYKVCVGFVRSDPRIHVALLVMRWPEEVERNARLLERFTPPLDVSAMSPGTAGMDGPKDAEVGGDGGRGVGSDGTGGAPLGCAGDRPSQPQPVLG